METLMKTLYSLVCLGVILFAPARANAERPDEPQATYYPPGEKLGGWRSLAPANGEPDAEVRDRLRKEGGADWDKLSSAWKYNAAAEGASGLLVIRHGFIVGEWYKDCERASPFNIYSCSKSYTSLAFGLLLADIEAGKTGSAKHLTLDTKVFTPEYLPEALPLTDPRKAEITLRHLLTMTSGIGGEEPPAFAPFEWALGKVPGSPEQTLKGTPGSVFNYSNSGVAHLVLIFNRVAGRDLFPFLKERLFEPIGMERISWSKIGGYGEIGPYAQGFSGINTTAREHARFLYLALHKGMWSGKQVVPENYYSFAWKGTSVKRDYGGLWWVQPHHAGAPDDLVQTAGFRQNQGYVIPSLDLVIVRVGNGFNYPNEFEHELLMKVLAAVIH
jgi:CubicO group peptidase (beta-lactamase class C family)